jgi:hypothetical protein
MVIVNIVIVVHVPIRQLKEHMVAAIVYIENNVKQVVMCLQYNQYHVQSCTSILMYSAFIGNTIIYYPTYGLTMLQHTMYIVKIFIAMFGE